MRVQIVTSPKHVCFDKLEALTKGLEAHGHEVFQATRFDGEADMVLTWGVRHPQLQSLRELGIPFLVAELGYIGDRRYTWTSLGFDGLSNAARVPDLSCPSRVDRLFPDLLKETKTPDDKALVLGQVSGDASLEGVDGAEWALEACKKLSQQGMSVTYRPHPLNRKRADMPSKTLVVDSDVPLVEHLNTHTLAVAYSSTSLIEAACEGLQVLCGSPLAMVYPWVNGDMDRKEWISRVAWRQWDVNELASGEAWEHLKECVE